MLFSYYDLLRCFRMFFLISGQCPLFYCRRFLRFAKVCWTKFYAMPLHCCRGLPSLSLLLNVVLSLFMR